MTLPTNEPAAAPESDPSVIEPEPSLPAAERESANLQTEPSSEASALGIDLNALEQMIGAKLKGGTFFRPAQPVPPSPDPQPEPKPDPIVEHLGELVDDMLDLLRRVKGIETMQSEMLARLERIETSVRDGARFQAHETDKVRRELLGEHSALAARTVAEAVFLALDKVRPMRIAVNRRRNEALANQLDATIEILSGTLRAFGFTAFEPPVGTPFDPTQMRCVGEKKGPPGVVLGVEQPGYLAKDAVLRPAGVLLAPSEKTAHNQEFAP